jgi:hypothetical protein
MFVKRSNVKLQIKYLLILQFHFISKKCEGKEMVNTFRSGNKLNYMRNSVGELALRIIAMLCILFLYSCSNSTSISTKAKPLSCSVLSSKFGMFLRTPDNNLELISSNIIPCVDGQLYGWKIRLDMTDETVILREELELPVPPLTWNVNLDNMRISEDRTTAITEKPVKLNNGWIINGWSVAAGDPKGRYILRIYINNKLLETYKFTLVE